MKDKFIYLVCLLLLITIIKFIFFKTKTREHLATFEGPFKNYNDFESTYNPNENHTSNFEMINYDNPEYSNGLVELLNWKNQNENTNFIDIYYPDIIVQKKNISIFNKTINTTKSFRLEIEKDFKQIVFPAEPLNESIKLYYVNVKDLQFDNDIYIYGFKADDEEEYEIIYDNDKKLNFVDFNDIYKKTKSYNTILKNCALLLHPIKTNNLKIVKNNIDNFGIYINANMIYKNNNDNNNDIQMITVDDYIKIYDNTGTNDKKDISIWKPKCNENEGWKPLGYFAKEYHDKPQKYSFVVKGSALKHPIDYIKLYEDDKITHWKPMAPNGYTSMGDICTTNKEKPNLNEIYCVPNYLLDFNLETDKYSSFIWDNVQHMQYDGTMCEFNDPSKNIYDHKIRTTCQNYSNKPKQELSIWISGHNFVYKVYLNFCPDDLMSIKFKKKEK